MKKIGRLVYRILLFFDKLIIVPITKIYLAITNFFKDNSKGIERFINNKQTLVVISLVFAITVFFVVDRNSNSIINNSAEVLYNQPVVADYNEESYVIEGLPEKVDVTLVGTKAYLYLAKQYSSNLKISADLTDMTPGKHKVSLKISQGLENIDYKVDPSTATVVVYEKVSATKELTYDVLHKDSLDTKLNISNIDLSRNDCIIKGADYKLKQVATVKALIDIDNLKTPKVGVTTMKDIPLVAYDASGNIVDVEIVPQSIEASIEIKSPSKTVPVKIVPKGNIAFGKSIKTTETSISTITIYGDQDSLEDIEYVPVEVDVTDLANDKEFNVNIPKPSGVREMSSKTMTVKIMLDDEITKEFTDIRITPLNLDSKYKVQAASEADGKITVIVKGSASVINELTAEAISASIDLAGLSEGTHDVDVKVTGEDLKVSYESKTKTVKIKITKAS